MLEHRRSEVVLHPQPLHRPVRVVAFVILETSLQIAAAAIGRDVEGLPVGLPFPVAQLQDHLPIVRIHRGVVQPSQPLQMARLEVHPFFPWHHPGGHHQLAVVPLPCHVQKQADLRPDQLQIAVVPGQQQRALRSDSRSQKGIARRIAAVPAVPAAPPLPIAARAHSTIETDVVRNDAASLENPLHPGLGVVEDPLPIALVAGVQEGVGQQSGATQVVRNIPLHHHRIEELAHLAAAGFALEPVLFEARDQRMQVRALGVPPGDAARIIDRVQCPLDELKLGVEQGPGAAVERCPDQPVRRIVVAGRAIPQVEVGETPHPLQVGRPVGICQSQ